MWCPSSFVITTHTTHTHKSLANKKESNKLCTLENMNAGGRKLAGRDEISVRLSEESGAEKNADEKPIN